MISELVMWNSYVQHKFSINFQRIHRFWNVAKTPWRQRMLWTKSMQLVRWRTTNLPNLLTYISLQKPRSTLLSTQKIQWWKWWTWRERIFATLSMFHQNAYKATLKFVDMSVELSFQKKFKCKFRDFFLKFYCSTHLNHWIIQFLENFVLKANINTFRLRFKLKLNRKILGKVWGKSVGRWWETIEIDMNKSLVD